MIYEISNAKDPIRQGDIFKNMPRMDVSLGELAVLQEGKQFQVSWIDLIEKNALSTVAAVVGVRPVYAIVITQDCDAVRSPDIALCEIVDFRKVELNTKTMADKPSKWVGIITQYSRFNQKWYYLPKSNELGFENRMGVDFRSVIRVGGPDLELLKPKFRIARLKDVALAHFRERIGEFFRRYAFDEWYPLTKEELDEYKRSRPEPIEPFPWQK